MAWPPHDAPALMNAERTLIIWDSQRKHEDFIRSVDFETKSENLGFIVPVPSIPEVTDAPTHIFEGLDREMERQRPVSDHVFNNGLSGGMPQSARTVEVVASFKLADFDVKVLKADSIEPLAAWLNANKFSLRPALKKWLAPYIDKKYYFTVFKFRKSDQNPGFTSKAVRISFDAEEPYYPYRDSEDMIESDKRHLLLYFLSDAPYSPDSLAARSALMRPEGWTGSGDCNSSLHPFSDNGLLLNKKISPLFSNRIEPIVELKGMVDIDKLNWLTVWEDRTRKRPDRDLSFVKDKSLDEPVLLCPR